MGQEGPAWVLDSGATHHVTGNSNLVQDFQACTSNTSMLAAGGEAHRIGGKGNVSINFPGGKYKQFKNVLYVPGIRRNLLSIGRITDEGCNVHFNRKEVLIRDEHTQDIIGHGTRMHRGLYQLHPSPVHEAHLVQVSNGMRSKVLLWHKRLGHINSKTLHIKVL